MCAQTDHLLLVEHSLSHLSQLGNGHLHTRTMLSLASSGVFFFFFFLSLLRPPLNPADCHHLMHKHRAAFDGVGKDSSDLVSPPSLLNSS